MEPTSKWQIAGSLCLVVLAIGVLVWAFTRTDEEYIVFSKASLQGKVTYKGKPVPHALVIVAGKGPASTGQADANGNFFVHSAPAGPVQIGVNTDAGRGMMMGAIMSGRMTNSGGMPTFVDVPKKFHAPTTSGVATTLTNEEGLNEFDVVLN